MPTLPPMAKYLSGIGSFQLPRRATQPGKVEVTGRITATLRDGAPPVCYAGPDLEVLVSSSIIWAVAGVLLVLWLLGFFVARLGDVIHLLLVLAVIVVAYKLIAGGRGTGV